MMDLFSLKKIVGRNIHDRRRSLRLTQCQLGEKMGGVTGGAVSKWERAESIPDGYNLYLLSKVFGCSVDDLMRRSW